jgi:hypothetical protein
MAVAEPGATKCQPSSFGGTKPSQVPVVLKFAAVIGGGVLVSSEISYGTPNVSADPVPALATTKAPTAATTPASRHVVKRALPLNTAFLLQ